MSGNVFCSGCQKSLETLDDMMRGVCNDCRSASQSPSPMAQEWSVLLENIEDGRHCPCCGQFVKAYRRKLRANHVRFLRQLVEKTSSTEPWLHYKTMKFAGRDYNYLQHFGLAQSKPGGFWKPTSLGYAFLAGTTSVPEWLLVYDNQVFSRSDRQMFVSECEASGEFDRAGLMRGDGS
jgi:hypothetical protein